ncbi:hypothetical protein DNTS_022121 [Danionella cerebrum]|uniref:sphingosine kinase n=1 Tax=Danionella cerebrum TaxID=2873325 RepID=A0A553R0M2_9TELE|nr:hypothetical protein DNTS_022121 [Danionella translucida]
MEDRNGRLHGVFTDAETGKLWFALTLSESLLTVQKLDSPPASSSSAPEQLDLADCLGSRALTRDRDALLCAYFYPHRRRWMASGPVRQREERQFRVVLKTAGNDNNGDEEEAEGAKLLEADRWVRAIRNNISRLVKSQDVPSLSPTRRSCGVMVLVNPQSGRGQAMALYNTHIQRMLTEAGVPHTLVVTERQNHARELVRSADLSQWDAVIILSGDGLLFEVVNGLMERPDWEQAIRTPLGILPGGSGNALAASLHFYSGASPVWGEDLLTSCGFLLCKALLSCQVSGLDLVSIRLSSGARLFSFLSLAWGFVADVDIESEQFRQIGAIRFILGTLLRLASLRVYRGRLAYLPAGDSEKGDDLTTDHLVAPLDEPVPQGWTCVDEQEFVLVLAMFQSHLSEDFHVSPDARNDDGLIHLYYVSAGVSRAALLRVFRAMQTGSNLHGACTHLKYVRAQALRLEPLCTDGMMTVDGERVESAVVQAQVHRAAARIVR